MILLDLGSPGSNVRDHINAPREDERPTNDRNPPAEVLAKAAVSAAIAAKDAVDSELFNSVRIGLMVSAARPGVKKLMFIFTDRTNPKRKMECGLSTAIDGQSLVLTTDCRGKIAEVARATIGDAAAHDAIRAAVDRFVFTTADAFAHPPKP